MANTKKIVILKQIREIETTVSVTLTTPDLLTQRQMNALADLSVVLRDIDKLILLNELNECIGDLESKSKTLKNISWQQTRHQLFVADQKKRMLPCLIKTILNYFIRVLQEGN